MRPLLLLNILVPLALGAQSATPSPVAACRTSSSAEFAQRFHDAELAARSPGTEPPALDALQAQRLAHLVACVRAVSLDRAPDAELVEVIGVAAESVDTTMRNRAAATYLGRRANIGSGRGAALVRLITAVVHANPARPDLAESLMDSLDAVPQQAPEPRMLAHHSMMLYYDDAANLAAVRRHAAMIITLSRLPRTATDSVPRYIVLSAYDRLADAMNVDGHADSALMTLDRVTIDHPDFNKTAMDRYFSRDRGLYTLVGKPAAPIMGNYWIDADTTARLLPLTGAITVIEFSATWCHPCTESYPTLDSLVRGVGNDPVRAVLATDLYGTSNVHSTALTRTEEVQFDRDFFGKLHNLPFPVAISYRPTDGASGFYSTNDANYHVVVLPTIIVVDRHGVVRSAMTGWDHGSSERLRAMIANLRREQ